MAIELTEQQRQALAQCSETPLAVVDPINNVTYVLIRAEVYQRFKEAVAQDEEIQSVREMYPHICDVMKDDWEDPAMRVYDEGDSR